MPHRKRNLYRRLFRGEVFIVAERSLTTLLQERASQQPEGTAFAIVDYEVDSNGRSIPITTSGKIRRSARCEYYRENEFERLHA